MKIILYKLEDLAPIIGSSYQYLRELMKRVKRGELDSYRGYRFVQTGNTWVAYQDNDIYRIEVHRDVNHVSR